LSQYPSPSLAGTIRNSLIPVIAFLDDPIDSVRYLKESTHCSFLEALRAQTAAATICGALFGNSSVLLINRSAGGTAGGVGGRILDQLGLAKTIASKFIEQFAGEAGAASWPLERTLSRRVVGYAAPGKASSITAEEAAVIDQVLSPMTLMAVHHDVEPISWPSSVFLYGDRPNERAPLVADVTGAARVIFYGPYFHLPPGRWQVQIVLGFSHDIFGTPFSIEVHGSELVAKTVVKPDGGGIFRGSFAMSQARPQDPLELRIRNEEGAIEGRIGLARARFFPQAH